jgi:hypothetical protein
MLGQHTPGEAKVTPGDLSTDCYNHAHTQVKASGGE